MAHPTQSWWGFRIRVPQGYDPPALRRMEVVTLGLLLGTALETIWLLLLAFRDLLPLFGNEPVDILKQAVVVPVGLATACLAIGLVTPTGLLAHTLPGNWVVMARERGNLHRWDRQLLLLGVAGIGAAMYQREAMLWGVEVCLLTMLSGACAGLLRFQQGVDFSRRRWQVEMPQWLLPQPGTAPLPDDLLVAPEDATHRFRFAVRDGEQGQEVGVRIDEALIQVLREVNAAHEGRLYHDNPLAVALMDRAPADVEAAREVVRALCRQLLAHARQARLTRFQFAAAILRFVQQAIDYAFDKDTTASLAGGPFEEYGRFAPETLYDRVGDCECTALLATSLLACLGYDAALIHVRLREEDGSTSGHAAVGLEANGVFMPSEAYLEELSYIEHPSAPGRRYLYGETAIDGGTRCWGELDPRWREGMVVERVVVVDRVGGAIA